MYELGPCNQEDVRQQASCVTLGEYLNLSEPAASSAKAHQGSALRAKLDHADKRLTADRERRCPCRLPEGPAASCFSVATGRAPAPSEELGCRDPPLHPRPCPQRQLASKGRHPGGCVGPVWDPWEDCLPELPAGLAEASWGVVGGSVTVQSLPLPSSASASPLCRC